MLAQAQTLAVFVAAGQPQPFRRTSLWVFSIELRADSSAISNRRHVA